MLRSTVDNDFCLMTKEPKAQKIAGKKKQNQIEKRHFFVQKQKTAIGNINSQGVYNETIQKKWNYLFFYCNAHLITILKMYLGGATNRFAMLYFCLAFNSPLEYVIDAETKTKNTGSFLRYGLESAGFFGNMNLLNYCWLKCKHDFGLYHKYAIIGASKTEQFQVIVMVLRKLENKYLFLSEMLFPILLSRSDALVTLFFKHVNIKHNRHTQHLSRELSYLWSVLAQHNLQENAFVLRWINYVKRNICFFSEAKFFDTLELGFLPILNYH